MMCIERNTAVAEREREREEGRELRGGYLIVAGVMFGTARLKRRVANRRVGMRRPKVFSEIVNLYRNNEKKVSWLET